MENLIKFLEDKITDKMSVEEIVAVFEQMCSTCLLYTSFQRDFLSLKSHDFGFFLVSDMLHSKMCIRDRKGMGKGDYGTTRNFAI